MSDYQIMTDSSCDIPDTLVKQYQIELIPYYVSFDQETYYKEREEIAIPDFYHRLQTEKVFPKTSLPSVQDYINHFIPVLKAGKDILCFCLTDKFSGSYQAAVNAQQILQEEYKESKIIVVNSILATSAQGLLVLEAARMQADGYPLNDVIKKVDQLKETAKIMFTVGTLEYLQKGGRIGKVSALAGNMLNLKPLIVLKDGELFPYGTVRGRKKSLKRIIEMTREHFEKMNASYTDYNFCLTTGTSFDEASQVKSQVEEAFGIQINYPIFSVGVTIGTNTGPDPVGICFIKKYEAL